MLPSSRPTFAEPRGAAPVARPYRASSPAAVATRAHELIAAPVPAELVRAFRFFFAVHVVLQSLKLPWLYGVSGWVIAVQVSLGIAALLTLHRRWYRGGLALMVAGKGYWVVASWPMAANHYYLELLVLLLLLAFADRPVDGPADGRRWVDGTACRLSQLALLSVYFYAGLHKLVHGMWHQGEFLTHSLFESGRFDMAASMRWVLDSLGLLAAEAPLQLPESFTTESFALSGPTLAVLLSLSWVILLSELAAPVLVLMPRTRKVGLVFLLAAQVGIGLFAWETEFMFGALGVALLFFPGRPWRNYSWLLALHVAWSVGLILSGLQVWEM